MALPFISSTFVPTDTMPGPVRAFADHQPMTAIVNAIRGLLTERPVGTDIWLALAWCAGILVLAYAFAMVTYRRVVGGARPATRTRPGHPSAPATA